MPSLVERIADLLSDGRPRWPPQIAAHLPGGPAPVATIKTALRAMCSPTTRHPLRIVEKYGYTLVRSYADARDAADELEKRVQELRRWQTALENWMKADRLKRAAAARS